MIFHFNIHGKLSISISINIIRYQAIFQQIYLQFCLDPYPFTFCLFSSDTILVLMSVCPTVSELRFHGCCHPCLFTFLLYVFTYLHFTSTESLSKCSSLPPFTHILLPGYATTRRILNSCFQFYTFLAQFMSGLYFSLTQLTLHINMLLTVIIYT